MDISSRYNEVLESFLVEHETKLEKHHQGKDLMDVLLEAKEDENAEYKITRDHIKSLFVWTTTRIINNPKVIERLREEMDSVVGKSRLIQETDLPNLPYLQAVVKEGLRMYPPVPLFGRRLQEGCKMGGFYVAEKTTLVINGYAIMRDPNYWDDPDEFKPERFLGEQGDEIREQVLKYLSFGSGRRGCPGSNLAYIFLGTAIGMMIQCFDWRIKGAKVNMEETLSGMVLTMAHPLKCIPVPRIYRRDKETKVWKPKIKTTSEIKSASETEQREVDLESDKVLKAVSSFTNNEMGLQEARPKPIQYNKETTAILTSETKHKQKDSNVVLQCMTSPASNDTTFVQFGTLPSEYVVSPAINVAPLQSIPPYTSSSPSLSPFINQSGPQTFETSQPTETEQPMLSERTRPQSFVQFGTLSSDVLQRSQSTDTTPLPSSGSQAISTSEKNGINPENVQNQTEREVDLESDKVLKAMTSFTNNEMDFQEARPKPIQYNKETTAILTSETKHKQKDKQCGHAVYGTEQPMR
ncbi:hypothetical protein DY000_02049729 [Brassica cretica]|uniref:Cytochrome P450 n=1 Tax=Brassica cretica TaxID=69181 RepID=A0ABQ7EPW7_BRACR|nr:hypothetical protein DY000_02049729 [Brassica cretica]